MGAKVRISVANLAAYVENAKTGEIVAISIFNKKKYERGFGLLQALGGAAKLSPAGKGLLIEQFGAEFAAEGEMSDDARFIVPAEHTEAVLGMFEDCEPDFCELDTMRELEEELVQSAIGGEPIVSAEGLAKAKSCFVVACRQVPADDGVGASENASKDVPTRRLFYIHIVTLPAEDFDRLLASPYIRRLSHEELATTEMGRKKGVSKEGITLADNICDYIMDVVLE